MVVNNVARSAISVFIYYLLVALNASSGQQTSDMSKTTAIIANYMLKSTSDDHFNYVAAPFAGSVIMALAAEGSEAETKSQLVEALGGQIPDKNSYKEILTSIKAYPADGNSQNKVVLKNFLYVYKNYSVLESFAELARDYYLTDVKSVARPDLEAVRATQNRQPEEISGDDSDATAFHEHAMLIFNGFSLEMSWPSSTWHRTSVSWDGNVVRAFGAAGNFAISKIPSLNCTAFSLPYKNTDFALLVLLPKNKDGSVKEILERLQDLNSFEDLTKTMSMKPAFVTMPCFQSSNITYMKTVLQEKSTVKSVFTESANLSKLSSNQLYLDDLVQQTGIRVCIDGASSYSLTSSAFTSQRIIKESVVVDRPFVYALYNVANNVIYVAGKLEQPVWEESETEINPLDSDIDVI